MQKKYTLSLIVILCALFLCVLILLQYQAYLGREEIINGVTYVNEYLSVNYMNGKSFQIKEEQKDIEFSITNQSDEPILYYIHFTNMKGTEKASYEITSSEKSFQKIEDNFTKTIIVSRYELKPHETHRYQMHINNPDLSTIEFDLDIDIDEKDSSFSSTILAQNEFSEDSNATGLIRKEEQYGEIYYFRGNVLNNYVSFAGLTWRIIKINEDKTVKLVLNNTTEEMLKMREESTEEKVSFQTSLLSQHLEEWYKIYLENVDSSISSTLYCFDDSIMTDENNRIEYLSEVRLFKENFPTNACGGTTISQKIALMTADEVMFAGGTQEENKDYYLYLDSIPGSWWTMTPNKKENDEMSYIVVATNGALEKDHKETNELFVRPVITLTKKTEVTGTGTITDPYTVK